MATVLDQVRTYSGNSDFMNSLKASLNKWGSLTTKQYATAEKFFAPKAEPVKVNELLPNIPAYLQAAATNLKYPKLHLSVEGVELVLKLKGKQSAHPGAVELVTKEKFWNEKWQDWVPDWFCRIDPDGTITTSQKLTAAMAATLVAINVDPKREAIKYAALTGSCSFCGLTLKTKESVSAGYGPICAAKWGLPWGEVKEVAAF